jgi:hypothetical protein
MVFDLCKAFLDRPSCLPVPKIQSCSRKEGRGGIRQIIRSMILLLGLIVSRHDGVLGTSPEIAVGSERSYGPDHSSVVAVLEAVSFREEAQSRIQHVYPVEKAKVNKWYSKLLCYHLNLHQGNIPVEGDEFIFTHYDPQIFSSVRHALFMQR